MPRLDQDVVARPAVASLRGWATVDDWAAIPIPGARQPARAELIVDERADLRLANAWANLRAGEPDDLLGGGDRRPDARDRGGRFATAQLRQQPRGGGEPGGERRTAQATRPVP